MHLVFSYDLRNRGQRRRSVEVDSLRFEYFRGSGFGSGEIGLTTQSLPEGCAPGESCQPGSTFELGLTEIRSDPDTFPQVFN